MGYHILLVEDQDEISQIVLKYLEKEGFTYKHAKNGIEALAYFHEAFFHLVLLDIMLPGIDGFDILSNIRTSSSVPVIMLTAKTHEDDRLKGFDSGADDYVLKPFSPRELMQRVKVLIKRVYGDDLEVVYQVGALELNTKKMKLVKDKKEIALTTAEFQVLKVLMMHKGQVLSREQLILDAFGNAYDGTDRNIDSHIKRIRQKIETDPKSPQYLHTKYGAGYVMEEV